MFNLVLVIVVIGLTAASVGAALYYLAPAKQRAEEAAKIDIIYTEAKNISEAIEMWYWTKGETPPSSVNQLVAAGYLKSAPTSGWVFDQGTLVNPNLSLQQCLGLNSKMGIHQDTLPACSSLSGQTSAICCQIN